jgi:hypothetical protein
VRSLIRAFLRRCAKDALAARYPILDFGRKSDYVLQEVESCFVSRGADELFGPASSRACLLFVPTATPRTLCSQMCSELRNQLCNQLRRQLLSLQRRMNDKR